MSWPAENDSPGAGDHQNLGLVVDREIVEHVVHVHVQLRAHRVALVGAVEGHQGDARLADFFSTRIVSYFLAAICLSPTDCLNQAVARRRMTWRCGREIVRPFYDTLPGKATVRSGANSSSTSPSAGSGSVGGRGDLQVDAVAHHVDPAGGAQEGDPADAAGQAVLAGLAAPPSRATQLDAFRPDRHRDRGRVVDPLRDHAFESGGPPSTSTEPCRWRVPSQAAGEQVGRPDEARDERIGRAGNRCPAASRSG